MFYKRKGETLGIGTGKSIGRSVLLAIGGCSESAFSGRVKIRTT
jgi:hypothetical protein